MTLTATLEQHSAFVATLHRCDKTANLSSGITWQDCRFGTPGPSSNSAPLRLTRPHPLAFPFGALVQQHVAGRVSPLLGCHTGTLGGERVSFPPGASR